MHNVPGRCFPAHYVSHPGSFVEAWGSPCVGTSSCEKTCSLQAAVGSRVRARSDGRVYPRQINASGGNQRSYRLAAPNSGRPGKSFGWNDYSFLPAEA